LEKAVSQYGEIGDCDDEKGICSESIAKDDEKNP
jgi:hypothetical protein